MADRHARICRRGLLGGVCALGVTSWAKADETDAQAASLPPQENDRIAFAFGERAGQAIRPEDLAPGGPQVIAYAMDPESGLVRDGTRLYQLVLIRLDPEWLSAATQERSVDGVVAYSGVCTHTGCDIEDFDEAARRFQCPCHESQFDPSDGARVVGGPAPWPLAALPLKLVDGQLAVARPFEGRVGFQQPGQSPFGI
jgi:rieske iron-sulfur protein